MNNSAMRNRTASPILFAALLPVAVAFASGCASLSTLEPPEVTLVDLRAVEMTVFETTLEAQLRISNPNPEPLALEGVALKLYLDGKKVGSGMSADTVEVPRLASAVLGTTFYINNASALLRLKEILEDREINYGLRGKLFVTRSYGTARLKIEREGRLDLERPSRIESLESGDPGAGNSDPQ